MQPGLQGKRIALWAAEGAAADDVQRELESAGAQVDLLRDRHDEAAWHGAAYAGLVLVGSDKSPPDARLSQLARELMVSEKPVAALNVPADALQLDESLLAVRGTGDVRRFAHDVALQFAERLEEQAVDEMSDLSFPASDPPAVSPGIAGRPPADPESRA